MARKKTSATDIARIAPLTPDSPDAEAREMAGKILNKKATLPRYLKRRERPWFRRAEVLLRQLPAS